MKKSFSIIAGVLLAGTVLAGCNTTETDKKENKDTAVEKAETKQEQKFEVEESKTGVQVITYKGMVDELSKATENKPVDWSNVKKLYESDLQTAVNEINGDFDQAIQAAISAGESGDLDPNVARQLIDKTTQSYFYQKQKSLHTEVADALEAKNSKKAAESFEELKFLTAEVFIPTAEKRDAFYELTGEDSIVENITNGLNAQEEAVKSGKADDYAVFKQITDKSIYRSYYLATKGYAKKIEDAVSAGGSEPTELLIMQAEGWGFLQAIKGSLAGGDEQAANRLDELFTLNKTAPSAIKTAEVSDLFRKAFIAKIKSYHEKVPTLMEKQELTEARSAAMEANVFMKAIELDLMEKLGEEKTDKLFVDAQSWYEAITSEKTDEATSLSKSIMDALSGL